MTTIYGHYGRPCTSCGREIGCNCYPMEDDDIELMEDIKGLHPEDAAELVQHHNGTCSKNEATCLFCFKA